MRDGRGRIVLGDFGTGRELDDPDDDRVGLTGTPTYLAPEIFRREPATSRSDVYSLGVLLYRLATARSRSPAGRSGRSGAATTRAHVRHSARFDATCRRISWPQWTARWILGPSDVLPPRNISRVRSGPGPRGRSFAWGSSGTLAFAVASPHDRGRGQSVLEPTAARDRAAGAGVVVQQVFPEFQRDVSIRGPAHQGRWVPCARSKQPVDRDLRFSKTYQ